MQDLEQAIRELAYEKWQEAGSPYGSSDAFWLAAQRDIISVALGRMGKVTSVGDEVKARADRPARSAKRRRAA